jgi:hypothetical protein
MMPALSLYDVFHGLVAAHIVFGAIGLVAFWIPVAGRKGSPVHKGAGKVFTVCILIAGLLAAAMSVLTLVDPLATHPKLDDAVFVRGIFGVMMLYLAILTMNLGWYGWEAVRNRRNHPRNRGAVNMALQPALALAATACAFEGVRIGQPMMVGMSVVGFATVATNLGFLLNRNPGPKDWLKEHVKALVGTGISVYTAFFAFGAVRLMPEIALQPALWAAPLIIGLGLILYHHARIRQSLVPPQTASATKQS